MYNADRAENQNLVSALSITINKILCQFFEFTQNLKRSHIFSEGAIFNSAINALHHSSSLRDASWTAVAVYQKESAYSFLG